MARWIKMPGGSQWVLSTRSAGLACGAEVFHVANGFGWMARQFISARGEGWRRVGDGEVKWKRTLPYGEVAARDWKKYESERNRAIREAKQEALAALRAVGCLVEK